MSQEQKQEQTDSEVTENSGVRTAKTNQDPKVSLEEARNAAAGEGPNAAGSSASSTAEEHVPGTSDPNATDLPSAR